MSPITDTAIRILHVYLTNNEVRERIDASPECYRALIHTTGIITDPIEFEEDEDEYWGLVYELERIIN